MMRIEPHEKENLFLLSYFISLLCEYCSPKKSSMSFWLIEKDYVAIIANEGKPNNSLSLMQSFRTNESSRFVEFYLLN